MNRNVAIFLTFLISTASLAGCLGGDEFDTSDLDQQIEDLQKSNDELNQIISDQTAANTDLLEQLTSMNLTLGEKEAMLASYNSSLELLELAMTEFELNVSLLENQILEAETNRDALLHMLTQSNSTLQDIQSQLDVSNSTLTSLQNELNEKNAAMEHWKSSFKDNLLSLEFLQLSGLDFSGFNLTNAVFTGANLSKSDMTGADLTGAELTNVKAVDLRGCPEKLPSDWACINLNLVGPSADLEGADLSNGQLQNMNLQDAILIQANLENANLSNANLKGSNLDSADMNGTDLSFIHGTNLVGLPSYLPNGWSTVNSNLVAKNADLTGANLRNTQLINLDLSNADLTDADLSGTTMVNVDFRNANFMNLRAIDIQINGVYLPADWSMRHDALVGPDANLVSWSVDEAYLGGLELQGADFSNSQLNQIDISFANLTGANFSGSYIQGADLTHTVLDYADLSHANLDNYRAMFSDVPTKISQTSMEYTNLSHSKLAEKDIISMDGEITSYSDLHLGTATLTGIQGTSLLNCPASLPSEWECIEQEDDYNRFFGYILIGNSANLEWVWLHGADLTSSKLSGEVKFTSSELLRTNLSGLPLSGKIDFSNAKLNGADLAGLDLSEAILHQVEAKNLKACPALLPSGWTCGNMNLIGPTARLMNANLSGVDMSGVVLAKDTSGYTGVYGVGLHSCPIAHTLDRDWYCISNNLVGPGASLWYANLQSADLSRLDLRGIFWGDADISGADLSNANLEGALGWSSIDDKSGVIWSNTICPNGTNSDDNGGSC